MRLTQTILSINSLLAEENGKGGKPKIGNEKRRKGEEEKGGKQKIRNIGKGERGDWGNW